MSPPLVLLHGFLGRGADWGPVAARFAGARRVLAPDLPGHGTAPNTAMDTLYDAVHALADRLDAERVAGLDLVGYSMGGRLALLFALRYPEFVRRLVLVSASPGLRTEAERAARRASDAALAAEIVADFPGFLDRWTRGPLFASLTDDQRARIVAERLAHGRPEALARALVGMGTGAMPSLWEPLRTLGVETHAVVGALDAKYVALAQGMAASGPARVHIIPGAGHNLLAEAPDGLADLLLRLLA